MTGATLVELYNKDLIYKKKNEESAASKIWRDTEDEKLIQAHPVWKWFGYFLNFFYAMACGFQTAGSLILAGVLTGGALYFCAALLFVVTSAINFKICRVAVPAIFIRMFAWNIDKQDKLYGGLSRTPYEKQKKSRWLTYALIGSLAAGLVFGALTVEGAIPTFGAFAFMGALSAAFYPMAIFFGAVMFVCLTCLLLKTARRVIKNWDWEEKKIELTNFFKTFLWENFYAKVGYDQVRKEWRNPSWVMFEYVLTIVLWFVFLPTSVIGVVMTMITCTQQFGIFVKDIFPSLSLVIVQVISFTLSMVLALIIQLPFYIETAVKSAITALGAIEIPDPSKAVTAWDKAWIYLIIVGRIINAVGNGLISMLGAMGNLALALVGLICGSIGSLVASQDNDERPGSRVSLFFVALYEKRLALALDVLASYEKWKKTLPPEEGIRLRDLVGVSGKSSTVDPSPTNVAASVTTSFASASDAASASSASSAASASASSGSSASSSSSGSSSEEAAPVSDKPAPARTMSEAEKAEIDEDVVDADNLPGSAPQSSSSALSSSSAPAMTSTVAPAVASSGSSNISNSSNASSSTATIFSSMPSSSASSNSSSATSSVATSDSLTPVLEALQPQVSSTASATPAAAASPSSTTSSISTPSAVRVTPALSPAPAAAPSADSTTSTPSTSVEQKATVNEKLKGVLSKYKKEFGEKKEKYEVPAESKTENATSTPFKRSSSLFSTFKSLTPKKSQAEKSQRAELLGMVITEIGKMENGETNRLKETLTTAMSQLENSKKLKGKLQEFLTAITEAENPASAASPRWFGRRASKSTSQVGGGASSTPRGSSPQLPSSAASPAAASGNGGGN